MRELRLLCWLKPLRLPPGLAWLVVLLPAALPLLLLGRVRPQQALSHHEPRLPPRRAPCDAARCSLRACRQPECCHRQ